MDDLTLALIFSCVWAFCLGHCWGYTKARKEAEKSNTHILQGGKDLTVTVSRDLVHKLIEDEGLIAMPKGMEKIINRKGRIDEH
jgi:hypothetical protein